MTRLPAITLLLALSHPASACHLWIAPELLRGRVAGVTLSVQGAAASGASINPGWTLSVSNDPSWTTNVTGHAIVGAAFLSGSEFLSMLTFSPEPGSSCDAIGKRKHSISVTLTFYKEDKLVRTRMDRSRLGFVP